jgi:hypothetical protein
MMIDDDLLMGLIVFDLVPHYGLKRYQTRSEAIRGESPSNSVQQGNCFANDPRCHSHLCRSIKSTSRQTLSSTHSHTHNHNPSHKSYTHIDTQFLIRMSFSPSSVPPLSRRNLSSRALVSSRLSSRLDVSISRLDRDVTPPPKSDPINGGSIHSAMRIRRFEEQIKGGTISTSPTGLQKKRNPYGQRASFRSSSHPVPFAFPVSSLSFSKRSSLSSLSTSLSQQ